jgi:hypothetical protein
MRAICLGLIRPGTDDDRIESAVQNRLVLVLVKL